MGDTEGMDLDKMSMIYLLFSLKQRGFMRKDLKAAISLLSFFSLWWILAGLLCQMILKAVFPHSVLQGKNHV